MNKLMAGVGILASVCLLGLGIYGDINRVEDATDKPKTENKPEIDNTQGGIQDNTQGNVSLNTDTLTCSATEYDEMYQADCTTTMTMTFENGELITMDANILYEYTAHDKYTEMFSSMVERSGAGQLEGLNMSWELNDSLYTYSINMNGSINEMKANGWEETSNVEDYSYESMLQYAKNEGLDCR